MSLYPPYLGAAIRVRRIANGFRTEMPLRFYNQNYFGTHFGGSLYSMCDPFFTLELTQRLGRDYWVWDLASTIRFVKPGVGRVWAEFTISDTEVEEVRRATAGGEKYEREFHTTVHNPDGEVAAVVDKTVYVRRRRSAR